MTTPNHFAPDHPEQRAYETKMSIWGTAATSDREKHAYRDGHHAGWNAAVAGIEEIASALRLAIPDKRAFAVCVDGRNGSTFTMHNCDDRLTCARMLERFARQQRGNDK